MKGKSGFTLVELLVVIAIITILASIVVPNVARYLLRGQNAAALSEIRSVDTALTAMLTDARVSSLKQLFEPCDLPEDVGRPTSCGGTVANLLSTQQFYTNAFYQLLRNGKTAEVPLRENVRARLGPSYLELGRDPWDSLYQIYPGPWSANAFTNVTGIPFRRYQILDPLPGEAPPDGLEIFNAIDDDGNPLTDGIGFPAKRSYPVYVYSVGQDLVNGQAIYQGNALGDAKGYDATLEEVLKGGGDDINNWDTDRSWEAFYR